VITVLVVASTAVARAGLESLVAASDMLRAVRGGAGTPLARQVEDIAPDVLLVEVDHRGLGPVLREIGGSPRAPAIVVLTGDPQEAWGPATLRAGVRAVLPHEATAAEILAAIHAATANLVVLHPSAVEALRPAAVATAPAAPGPASQLLTAREVEVLRMMADGLGNKLIAARLGISEHTVKFHIASIFAKLDAGSRTEAVTIGIRLGLILI
jgi:NarL family two-component system response regulator YdfI